MIIQYAKPSRWIITLIIGIVSFFSCSDEFEPGICDISVRAEHELVGNVLDEEQKPIAEIEVTLSSLTFSGIYKDTTDNNGNYVINVPESYYHPYPDLFYIKFQNTKNDVFIEKIDSLICSKYTGGDDLHNWGKGYMIKNMTLVRKAND